MNSIAAGVVATGSITGHVGGTMNKFQQFSIWYVLLALFLVSAIEYGYYAQQTETLSYSEFKTLLKAGKLADLSIGDEDIQGLVNTRDLEGVLSADQLSALKRSDDGVHRFVTVRVQDDQLEHDLETSGVRFVGRPEHRWLASVMSTVVWVGLFLGIWMYAARRMRAAGGMMSVGQSRARVYVERDTKVTFDDIGGVDEAREEIEEIVRFLKSPALSSRLGARVPKGILLVGPPGTGKTLFARAMAGEAGVPFFSISGSEFVEMFVGVGAARVRDLFEQARQQAPAIIFIDELDALGRARGMGGMLGGHDEKEQTLNQLLVELDGFDPSQGVVILAATNRPEVLDPALLRAGRFDRQVLVDRPDKIGRAEILRIHMQGVTLDAAVSPEEVAALTPGFTGADLANLVNEAALLATRRGGDSVTMDDVSNAMERMVAGLEKRNRLLNEKEKRIVAYHEMGHALVAMALPGADTVHKISIIPRGVGALGYTIQRPTEERFLMTRQELIEKMAVLLGGRAAERLVFGHLSTGAADDLVKVSDIARSMVLQYGMEESLGNVVFGERSQYFQREPQQATGTWLSEETAEKIDDAVQGLVEMAYGSAVLILSKHRDVLDKGAERLLDQETLGPDDLEVLNAEMAESSTRRTDARLAS